MKNDSCAVHEDFQKAIRVCYDSYSTGIEDMEPFGNGYRKHTSADALSQKRKKKPARNSSVNRQFFPNGVTLFSPSKQAKIGKLGSLLLLDKHILEKC